MSDLFSSRSSCWQHNSSAISDHIFTAVHLFKIFNGSVSALASTIKAAHVWGLLDSVLLLVYMNCYEITWQWTDTLNEVKWNLKQLAGVFIIVLSLKQFLQKYSGCHFSVQALPQIHLWSVSAEIYHFFMHIWQPLLYADCLSHLLLTRVTVWLNVFTKRHRYIDFTGKLQQYGSISKHHPWIRTWCCFRTRLRAHTAAACLQRGS